MARSAGNSDYPGIGPGPDYFLTGCQMCIGSDILWQQPWREEKPAPNAWLGHAV